MISFLHPRRHAPATQRNREPILEVLLKVLPPAGTVLEIASGTGEHAVYFAPRLKPRLWLPSDPDPEARASIAAWVEQCPAENLRPPLALDTREPVWGPELESAAGPEIAAIVAINMIHIAPWPACLGLMAGAARLLPPGGVLFLYGPYRQGGQHTAPSNAAFDASLRAQNSAWGVRDLDEVADAARRRGLALVRTFAMPANNLAVVFRA
jgi:SAM-dependent methyltransferase